jgi:competence protein ComEA
VRALLLTLLVVLGLGCEAGEGSRTPPPIAARIDLNRATAEQLEALPEIGARKARSIIASRNARGGKFERVEDLLEIDGIGKQTFAAILPYVELVPK